jgi:hypothetical protein
MSNIPTCPLLPHYFINNYSQDLIFIFLVTPCFLEPGVQILFKFNLLNPVSSQLAPQVDIHLAYQRPPYESGMLGSTCQYACDYMAQQKSSTENSWRCPCNTDAYKDQCVLALVFNPPGERGTLAVDPPLLVYKNVGQSTSFPGETNTIIVTLATNIAMDTQLEPSIIISGFVGSMTPDSALAITSKKLTGQSGVNSQTFGLTGTWRQEQGSLTMSLGGNIDRAQNYSLAFQLKNPVRQRIQATTMIVIEAQKGFCRRARENYPCPSVTCDISSCTSRLVFASTNLVPATGVYAPMLIDAPNFLEKSISHSSALPGQMNTITISLSFNVAIAHPTRVTISGLQGTYIGTGNSGTSTDIHLTDLRGSKATELFSAQFDPLAAVLTLSVVPTLQVVPAKLYVMSFVVRMSMSTQDAPEVFIGTIGGAATFNQTRMKGSVLNILQPDFMEKTSGQSSSYPGAVNSITITLMPNTDFTGMSTQIRVNGLYGAMAATGTVQLRIVFDNTEGNFLWTAQWNQSKGTLVTINEQTIASRTRFRIVLEAINRLAPQPPPVLQASISFFDPRLFLLSFFVFWCSHAIIPTNISQNRTINLLHLL